ncbi:MAG: hypothetical protein ACK40G_01480 [Cytophagaceae bacterium]
MTKVQLLYKEGTFLMAIRYYGYKVNLYILGNFHVEVFYNHKLDKIEKIEVMDKNHTRMKFYADQIKLNGL